MLGHSGLTDESTRSVAAQGDAQPRVDAHQGDKWRDDERRIRSRGAQERGRDEAGDALARPVRCTSNSLYRSRTRASIASHWASRNSAVGASSAILSCVSAWSRRSKGTDLSFIHDKLAGGRTVDRQNYR